MKWPLITARQAEKYSLDVCLGKRGQNLVRDRQELPVFPLIYQFASISQRLEEIHPPASSKETTEIPNQLLHKNSNSRISGDKELFPSHASSLQGIKEFEK